jgi:hypothetical protein
MGERRSGDPKTGSFHAKTDDGSTHLVGIRNLRVVIRRHEDHWFAQGVEIDYSVEGTDIDDVRRAFEEGLARTINANLNRFGHIEGLMKPAPRERADLPESTILNHYSQLSTHRFPFTIQFLQAA